MHNVLPYPGHLQRHWMLLKRKSNESFSHDYESPLFRYSRFSPIFIIMYSFTILWSSHSPLCVSSFPHFANSPLPGFTPFPVTISLSTHLYLSSLLYQESISHGSLIPFPSVYSPLCLISTFFSNFHIPMQI